MKRDFEFLKCLLEHIEEHDQAFHAIHIEDDTFTEPSEKVKYHLRLIRDAGFIRALQVKMGYIVVKELTWAGHEYLDSLRRS